MRLTTAPNPTKVAASLGAALLLVVTWLGLYLWLMAATEFLLVPWDLTPQRPPPGTLAREVNDFFEHEPGAYLPAAAGLGVSVGLFAVGLLRKRAGRTRMALQLVASNLAFMVLELPGQAVCRWLVASRLPPPQTGV